MQRQTSGQGINGGGDHGSKVAVCARRPSQMNSVFYGKQYFLRCYSAAVWKICLPFICKATEQRANGVLSGPSLCMRLMRSMCDAAAGRSGAANLTCLTRQSKSTASLPKNVLKRVSRACKCRVCAWKIKEEKNNKS